MAVTLEEVTVMRQFYEIDEITKESVRHALGLPSPPFSC